jgi:hypothetical protein
VRHIPVAWLFDRGLVADITETTWQRLLHFTWTPSETAVPVLFHGQAVADKANLPSSSIFSVHNY